MKRGKSADGREAFEEAEPKLMTIVLSMNNCDIYDDWMVGYCAC
ncbi:hypothetical protein [Vibrio nigripulchritudo]|nr:hypothetical protein [Vibrio nigripulchritudo]